MAIPMKPPTLSDEARKALLNEVVNNGYSHIFDSQIYSKQVPGASHRSADQICADRGHAWGPWTFHPVTEPLQSVSWKLPDPDEAVKPTQLRRYGERKCQRCGGYDYDA